VRDQHVPGPAGERGLQVSLTDLRSHHYKALEYPRGRRLSIQ
jgi:hypothetical protein